MKKNKAKIGQVMQGVGLCLALGGSCFIESDNITITVISVGVGTFLMELPNIIRSKRRRKKRRNRREHIEQMRRAG